MQKYVFRCDISIFLWSRHKVCACANGKWQNLDEIIIFWNRDLDIRIQRAKIYQKLHRKYNFLICMQCKKQSTLQWHVQKFDKIAWQSWPAGFRRCEGSRTWHKLRRTSSFDPQTTLTVQRGSKCVKIDQIWNQTFQLKKSKNHRCSYAQALFLDSLVRTKVPACKRVGGGVGCPLGWRYRGQFCPNFGFYRSDRKNDKNLQKNSKR